MDLNRLQVLAEDAISGQQIAKANYGSLTTRRPGSNAKIDYLLTIVCSQNGILNVLWRNCICIYSCCRTAEQHNAELERYMFGATEPLEECFADASHMQQPHHKVTTDCNYRILTLVACSIGFTCALVSMAIVLLNMFKSIAQSNSIRYACI